MDDTDISIRLATGTDVAALCRVAQRDSRPLPQGDLLVAVAQGEIRAALSLQTREVVADPFRPTAALVELLKVRAGRPARGGRGTRGRVGKLAFRSAET